MGDSDVSQSLVECLKEDSEWTESAISTQEDLKLARIRTVLYYVEVMEDLDAYAGVFFLGAALKNLKEKMMASKRLRRYVQLPFDRLERAGSRGVQADYREFANAIGIDLPWMERTAKGF